MNGAVDVAGGSNTFQTGDIINGTANGNNKLNITDAGARGAVIAATVNNVAEIKHNALASNAYNEALYTGVGEEYLTNSTGTALAPVVLTLTNAQLATTFGAKDSTAGSTTLSVGIRAADLTGLTSTLKLSVRNAGSTVVQAGVAPVSNVVTLASTSGGIETISILTSGVNNVAVTAAPTAGVTTDYAKMVVTGDGANTIDVSALTQTTTFDLSGATAANTLNFGAALLSNTVITGGTGADTLRVNQGTVVAGVSLTNVETLRSSVGGATGTIAFTTGGLTTLRVDGDGTEAGRLTLVSPGSIATMNYIGDGVAANSAAVQQFKAVTITGAYAGASDVVAVNISNAGTTQLIGYTVNAGAAAGAAILANGIETLNVTVNDIAATATTTFTNGVASNTLQSIKFTSAGAIAAGVINAAPTAGQSALTTVDLSAVTSSANSSLSFSGAESVGAATQIKGPAGTGALTITTGIQGDAGTQVDSLLVTGGGGNTTINAQLAGGGAAFNGILTFNGSTAGVTNTLNVGDTTAGGAGVTTSTTVATFTGAGSTNNVVGGSGADTITVTATGVGSANSITGGTDNDVLNAAASTANMTFIGGAGADTITGGTATNTSSYAGSAAAVTVNLTTGVNTGGDAQGDVLVNIQNLIGSGNGDTLTGSAGNNVLNGAAGADVIAGGGGNDTIIGGTGNDTMTGGAGVDTYSQVLGDSTAATAASNAAGVAIANADTITFGNGAATVDVITNFVSGVDKIDTTTAGSVSTLMGILGNAALTVNANYFLVGTYTGGVFTVNSAATAATANVATLVLADAAAAAYTNAAQTDYIMLTGIAGVVVADFI